MKGVHLAHCVGSAMLGIVATVPNCWYHRCCPRWLDGFPVEFDLLNHVIIGGAFETLVRII